MTSRIDLNQPLSIGTSFRFPMQSALSRREITIGALLLVFLPGVGWMLNMGHRIEMVHRMQCGLEAWPAWPGLRDRAGWWALLGHGFVTFVAMVAYHAPGALLMLLGRTLHIPAITIVGALLWTFATVMVPGFMSHYCVAFDRREVFDPIRALRRVREGGTAYWHAWTIAVAALALSFFGLLGGGVLFFWTSVWFWQVAGFSFATVFSRRFRLLHGKTLERVVAHAEAP